MVPKFLLLWLVAYWLISVGVAAWFGQMKGRVIEALALGVLMGPFGSVLAALLPDAERSEKAPAPGEPEAVAHPEHAGIEHEAAHEEAPAAAETPETRRAPWAFGSARKPSWRKGRPERRPFEIDWGWAFFYGSWALFVGVSWLWLLLFG